MLHDAIHWLYEFSFPSIFETAIELEAIFRFNDRFFVKHDIGLAGCVVRCLVSVCRHDGVRPDDLKKGNVHPIRPRSTTAESAQFVIGFNVVG